MLLSSRSSEITGDSLVSERQFTSARETVGGGGGGIQSEGRGHREVSVAGGAGATVDVAALAEDPSLGSRRGSNGREGVDVVEVVEVSSGVGEGTGVGGEVGLSRSDNPDVI